MMQDAVNIGPPSHMYIPSRIGATFRSVGLSRVSLRSLSEGMENRLKLFQGIGLSEQKARETAKNEKLAGNLEVIVNLVGLSSATVQLRTSLAVLKLLF